MNFVHDDFFRFHAVLTQMEGSIVVQLSKRLKE